MNDVHALVQNLRNADPDALSTLYDWARPSVRAIGQRYRLNPWDEEEILQDVVWTAYRKIASLRDDDAFRGWLRQIVRNAALMHLRRNRRAPQPLEDGVLEHVLSDSTTPTVRSTTPEENVQRRRMTREIAGAYASLSPLVRQAFTRVDLDGEPTDQAARALGITVGALKGRLHRARTALLGAALAA